MSASQKKQLRKEQNAAKLTEKQQQEVQEAKKLRLYTIAFTAVIALMLVVVIVTSVNSSGILQRNTTALTVGETDISAVELNYFYVDAVNAFLNQYADYLSWFGIDTSKALDEQVNDEEAGTTWADYFIESAASNAKGTYAIYNHAVANGYTLPEEAEAEIESTLSTLELYAIYGGYGSAEDYIKAVYGAGSSEESYRAYCEAQYLAMYYSNEYYDSLEYADEDLRAAEEENYDLYSYYTYNYYYLSAEKFLKGGTKDEEGNTTYSDEEKASALALCETEANNLANGTYADLSEFNKAIDDLMINAETTASSTSCPDYDYSSVNELFLDWMNEEGREAGDIAVFPYESEVAHTHEEGEEHEEGDAETEIKGYYVVYFGEKNDNAYPLVNIRHILVEFEGGTEDDNGNVTYSDEEKAAAKAEAEALLATFLSGEKTEEAFAAMAEEHSTDGGSNTNGGLYEDIVPGQMVTNFNDWSFDSSREAGDTGIVESEYGYHVMYFSGNSETVFRDYLIENDLREADYSEWESEIIADAEMELKTTKYVKTDITLG